MTEDMKKQRWKF